MRNSVKTEMKCYHVLQINTLLEVRFAALLWHELLVANLFEANNLNWDFSVYVLKECSNTN